MANKAKILIVDDNERFCQNVKDILELKNFTVSTAHDGHQALKMAEQKYFDLVLMDVKMPVMNGVETLKKMKAIFPDIAVIMITAYSVDDLIRESLREGAFGVLSKPLDFEKLFKLIEEATTNGGLILVADDDPELCNNMTDVLTEKGYRVDVAGDGKLAVQMAKERDFDLILLDLKLPALNGLEVYLEIRDVRPNVVVIVITGFANELKDMAEAAVEKNAYIWLEKPINMDNLIDLITKIEEQKVSDMLKKPS